MDSLRTALVSISAVLASFGLMYAVCVSLGINASPAVLSAALTLSLMRRAEPLEWRALLIKFLGLPLVALAAGLVGLALLHVPPLGAALFIGGITVSILLRRYGPRAAALGRVVALPLMAILVVPVRVEGIPGHWLAPLLMIGAGICAEACAAAATWFAGRLGVAIAAEGSHGAPRPARAGQMHIATRMALQMFTALTLAFAIGMALFPAHWFWVVLTAFIVCSGTITRGDAIYKGLLRLGGAAAGAVVAALAALIVFPDPAAYAAVSFFVLFLGIWLRPINYAYWAACTTLLFALLQGSHETGIVPLLGARLLCILVGALCGIAAAWFVYPIRSEQLVRRRVADALAALRDHLPHKPGSPEHESGLAQLAHHAKELERAAAPLRLHRRLFGSPDPERHPAVWIERMHALLAEVRRAGFDRAGVGAEMRRLGAMLRGQSDEP